MKPIPLTRGKFSMLDDEDFDLVSRFKWRAKKNKCVWYAVTSIKLNSGRRYELKMHRLLMRAKPEQLVDHVDRNGLNNQKNNLRLCNAKENARNRRGGNGKSIYKGLTFRGNGKWQVFIWVDGGNRSIGCFDDEVQAAEAYDKAAKSLFGAFAYLNFPEQSAIS